MAYTYYTVTVTPKLETWNCKPYQTRCYAKSREAAIKQARAEYKENHQDHGQRPATYRATKEDDGESRYVGDNGYNVEFFGAIPAKAGEDY
jgi:hypothetical protein